ncbi:MAG: hypothetical protein ACOX2F_07480 [bacterium]
MKNSHIAFISTESNIKAILVESGEEGVSFLTKNIPGRQNEFNFKEQAKKLVQEKYPRKADQPSKASSSIIDVPAMLLPAVVTGMTLEGSLEASLKIAKFMLLDVRKTFLISNMSQEEIDSCSENVFFISGGYDESENDVLKDFITKLYESEYLRKIKPTVVFAGSTTLLHFAKAKIGSLTEFVSLPNVLETVFSPEDLTVRENFFLKESSTITLFSKQQKVRQHSLTDFLHRLTEMFCGKNTNNVLSLLMTERYSVAGECCKSSGMLRFQKRGIPLTIDALSGNEVFESFLDISKQQPLFDTYLNSSNILEIEPKKKKKYLRPDRIVSLSLCEEANLDKFIDMVCNPDVLKGIIEFVFDKEGAFLALAAMFFDEPGDCTSWLLEAIFAENVVSGWIVIPDGVFVKGKEALSVHISGEEESRENLLWGKRYALKVKPLSTIEIETFKGASFEGIGKKRVFKTGKSSQMVVFDLRETEK